MNTFGIMPDEADNVSNIHELTEWFIKNEFFNTVKGYYNKTLPFARMSELVTFMAGQLNGAHILWNAITGESYNAQQINECSEIIAWMAKTYEPGYSWERKFGFQLDDTMTSIKLLAIDQEGENEQIEET